MPDSKASEAARHLELGRFLRARRESLQPEQFGFVRRPRRRVPGLLRYEVAELAGVSDTWYTWLEQGRDIRVSSESLEAVGRALQLDDDARDHVRRLANLPTLTTAVSTTCRPELLALVDDLLPHPASVTTATFDLVAWNRAHALVFGDPGELPVEQRNNLRSLLLNDQVRKNMQDWETETQGVVARFRFESGKYPGDPRFDALIAELTESSAHFRDFWGRAQVHPFVERDLVIEHPELGRLQLSKLQLRPIDQPSLLLSVHRPTDERTRAQLAASFS